MSACDHFFSSSVWILLCNVNCVLSPKCAPSFHVQLPRSHLVKGLQRLGRTCCGSGSKVKRAPGLSSCSRLHSPKASGSLQSIQQFHVPCSSTWSSRYLKIRRYPSTSRCIFPLLRCAGWEWWYELDHSRQVPGVCRAESNLYRCWWVSWLCILTVPRTRSILATTRNSCSMF